MLIVFVCLNALGEGVVGMSASLEWQGEKGKRKILGFHNQNRNRKICKDYWMLKKDCWVAKMGDTTIVAWLEQQSADSGKGTHLYFK